MLIYELIDRARQAGLKVFEVKINYPHKHSTKTVIKGDDLTITVWPSGILTIADSSHPIGVDGAARYLRLCPQLVKEQ